MAAARVLGDTTLFIEHLRARNKESTHLYRLASQARVETCAVVAAEIFYGARKADSEKQARAVLQPFPIHPFTAEMAARECAVLPYLRERNAIPDLRDLMIAVTALHLSLPVATLNQGHFNSIPGVELLDLAILSSS